MQLQLAVTRHGTAETVTTRPVDLVAWERETGRGLGSLGESPRFTDLALMAYYAATRGTPNRPDFDTWLADLDSVELAQVEAGDPTQSAP